METYQSDRDIKVLYVTATSFPDGVMEAYQKLHALLPGTKNRNFFGISYPDKEGKIMYKAAVEEIFVGEAELLGCETFIIRKGTYISELIPHFADNMASIGTAFKQMIADPRIDPDGCCVEMYLNENDVRCMVRLAEQE
ncbi:MAG: transcriptional regulator [Taibaiella sp.]|nr:transcriptional regulator [Taibaiella sp.]